MSTRTIKSGSAAPRMASEARACAYVRVSTEEQATEGVSLDAQQVRVRAYCQLQGLELVEIFREEGVSAGKPLRLRPQGARLLELVETNAVGHVIGVKLDRMFRNTMDCLHAVESWDQRGVALHLLDLGGQALDTRSPAGRFFLTVMAGAAEMERGRIRERVRDALAHKRLRGDRLGTTPLGFTTQGAGAPMEPNAAELTTVAHILTRREAGDSFRLIARELNARGVPTKRGKGWDHATVRAIWGRRERYLSAIRATT